MMSFLEPEIKSFGLDISDLSLKFLDIEETRSFFSKKKEFGLKFALERGIKPGIIEGGEIKNERALAETIKEIISAEKQKIRKKYVTFSLPEERSFLRVIQLPWMEDKKALKKAASFEAENYIPLKLEEVYIDSEVISSQKKGEKKIDVLIAASPRKLVDSYVNVIKKAGLFPKAAEIESLSLTRALLKKDEDYPPLFIIDFGATRTSFVIFSGRSIKFTTTIPISSQSLTKSISDKLRIPFKKAEAMKRKYGLLSIEQVRLKEKSGDGSFEKKILQKEGLAPILRPMLEKLVLEAEKHINYYLSHISQYEHMPPDGQEVKKIILCGGGSNLKGLSQFLEKSLRIPVEKGNPWINFYKKKKRFPLSHEESLSFTTAIGLAAKDIFQKND